MRLLFLSISIIIELSVYGQRPNQEHIYDREDSLARQFFDENYKQQNFSRYTDSISIIDDTIKYSGTCMRAWVDTKYNNIFISGIIYPKILTQWRKTKSKSILTISNFEELDFLSESPTVKRFRFWLTGLGEVKPTVCLIELTNLNSTSKTTLSDFIKGASLTFFRRGWFII